MKHLEELKARFANAKTLSDVFDTLRLVQAYTLLWDHIAQDFDSYCGTIDEALHVPAGILAGDIQAIRATLAEMQEKVKGWSVRDPSRPSTAAQALPLPPQATVAPKIEPSSTPVEG